MVINLRRRSMLNEPSESGGEVNGLDHVEFADASTSTAFINDSGNLACTGVMATAWKSIRPYFRSPIHVRTGDLVTLEIKHVSGTNFNIYVDIGLSDVDGANIGTTTNNVRWRNDADLALSLTWTTTGDGSLYRFWFYPRSGSSGMVGPSEYSVQIYVNGEAQFG